MKRALLAVILFSLMIFSVQGREPLGHVNPVRVRVISDSTGELPVYSAHPRGAAPGTYYYMEAAKGDRYSIEVANQSGRRIGVVIAVDGRNIISGGKSHLRNTERMYIIDPYTTNSFEGWRTGMNRTNRFYFTDQPDSYAERAFSDASAMGTIAVAVYMEKIRRPVPITPLDDGKAASPTKRKRSAGRTKDRDALSEQAGTGFGETVHSPAREVQFEAESAMAERIVLKYEWRAQLCRRGVISCDPPNRFWPVSHGFAPVPEDFRE